MNKENKTVEKKVKEEIIPENIQEAYSALKLQVKGYAEQEIKALTMKTKATGALEVLLQMYPTLEENKSDS